MKKYFVVIFLAISLLMFGYNFFLEYSLNKTSRSFTESVIKVPKSQLLSFAANTYDWPRLYRKNDSYSDLNGLVITLLYLKTEDLSEAVWGIRKAINLLDMGVKKYPSFSLEHYYLLQKKLSVLNRAPNRTQAEIEAMRKDSDELIQLGSSIKTSQENIAYAYIEKMLLQANANDDQELVDESFNKSLEKLTIGDKASFEMNKKKFEFYYGYAQCLLGNSDGGDLMVDSYRYLSKFSETFYHAMFVNWDGTLIGLLLSPKSSGYEACHKKVAWIKN